LALYIRWMRDFLFPGKRTGSSALCLRPTWGVARSGVSRQSEPTGSPVLPQDTRRSCGSHPTEGQPAMEFRSPAFQPVGLPIRTEFRVGWMAEGRAPFRPRADQEEDLRDRGRASAGGSNASKGGGRDQGSERRSAIETAPAKEPPRDERRAVRAVPDRVSTTATRPSTVSREGPAPTPHLH